jgi:hypothetical protein
VQTVVNDGSKLLIFVPRAAHSDDLSLLFVVKPAVVHGNSLGTARRVRLGADEYDLVLVGKRNAENPSE